MHDIDYSIVPDRVAEAVSTGAAAAPRPTPPLQVHIMAVAAPCANVYIRYTEQPTDPVLAG